MKIFSYFFLVFLLYKMGACQEGGGNATQPSPPSDSPDRVLGGKDVSFGEYPYILLIEIDRWACTGTLITPSWGLTTAHCLDRTGIKKIKVSKFFHFP